jgi:hypothetical protein
MHLRSSQFVRAADVRISRWDDAVDIADYIAFGFLIAYVLLAAAMVLPRRHFPPPRL